MAKCAICGKETGEASGVHIEIMRGSEKWSSCAFHLCPDHREAVYEAAKDGAREAVEKKEAIY